MQKSIIIIGAGMGGLASASKDLWGELMLGSAGGVIKTLP